MPRIMMLALAVLSLAGCASNQIPAANIPPSARSVSIVVSTPQQIRLATTGISAFENALDLVDIPDWHLDDAAFTAAAAALSPRYQITRVILKGPVVDYDAPIDKLTNSQTAIEKQADKFIDPTAQSDLYVIISQGNAANHSNGMRNVFVSVGVSKTRDMFRTIDPVAHTFLQVTVLDGKTGKTIATSPLHTTRLPKWTPDEFAAEYLVGFDWKDYWHEMSAQQQDLIRERITALLAESVGFTVKKIMAIP